MSKANRRENMAACVLVLMGILFWVSIVTLIWGITIISLLASIGYAVCVILLEAGIYGKEEKVKKRIQILLVAEAMQLVPYVLIFVIRK